MVVFFVNLDGFVRGALKMYADNCRVLTAFIVRSWPTLHWEDRIRDVIKGSMGVPGRAIPFPPASSFPT